MAVVVYALAVIVRLAWLSEARHNPLYQYPIIDERTHHEIGKAIANGTAPNTAYLRAPAYLYFLGGIYKVLGPDSLHARYVQVFVAGLLPVLVLLIADRLFGPGPAVLAGVLASVFWTFVFFSTELLDVSLACVFYLLLAYLLIALDDGRWTKWLLCGAVLGLGAITRPNILAYPPFLVLAVLWARRSVTGKGGSRPAAFTSLRSAVAKLGIFAGGCVLTIAPVTVRNIVVAGEPILIAAWGSGAFWATNNEASDAKRLYRPDIDISTSPLLKDLLADPWFQYAELAQAMYIYAAQHLGGRPTYRQANAFYTRLNLEYVRNHPRKLFRDSFERLCFMFNGYEYPFNKDLYAFLGYSRLLRILSCLHFGVICPLGVVGVLLAVTKRTWPTGLAYYVAMILALVLPGTLFPVTSRYRLPIVYLLMPMVAFGVFEIIRLVRARSIAWRRVSQPLALLAVLAVFCNANVFGFRPAPAEYLVVHFFGACVGAGRDDLAIQTVDEIALALDDPTRQRHVPPNTTIPLFGYLYQHGDLERAARFGRYMIRRRDQADAQTLDTLTHVFVRLGRQEDAKLALAEIERVAEGRPSHYLAQSLLRYGRAFRDRSALVRAAELYTELIRRHPEQPKFRNAFSVARRALADLADPACTRPTATTRSTR